MRLEIDSLNAYYGNSHILHDVSLAVSSDEIVALLGRNGAGKTTTCRSITGTVPRIEGEIMKDGENLVGFTPNEIFNRGVAWIPEGRRVFPNLTVKENLRMGLRKGGDETKKFREVFSLFPKLSDRAEQRGGTLSGGEQQMLAIGRALMADPDLLIVDEPFEGLMPQLVSDVLSALLELADRDVSMLVTDQQTVKTLELADSVYIIERGTIVHEDDAESVASNRSLLEQHLGVQ